MLDKARCEGESNENVCDSELPLSFTKDRHTETIEGINCITQTWRMKERMKTVSVALVLCLNVGVDPPDIVKTQPCARFECWIDPLSLSPSKALEAVGNSLQKQYERWQPRARYKQSLDPTVEEVKKLCTSLRRNAKEERVLFHYNGHGVPKPTANGEIWVFNRNYTQYIPLSVYDLQTWMGAPSIYVYDCSNAGIIVESFKQFAEQHERESEKVSQGRGPSPALPSYRNCIQLAACRSTQVLPMNPDLPADLFTACLTTPIKVALRWFVMQNTAQLVPKVTLDLIDKIPGQLNDRRTMLGELNWIFTAITDTIAWNTLPRDLFQKLFRQDLLVASLFRNFLLAERILRSYDCTPVSWPMLPPTFQHPMWQAWDLALDLSLGQLPGILTREEPFVHLPFFEEQLTAFQVWLELGSEKRNPPEQLPIVLQVLLSQVHRLRALELLGRFLDLGPWAVNLALSVGIFPYVLKLLQSSAKELRPLLVFIWAKILAVDSTCQADLVRDSGHKYFLSVFQDPSVSSEHRTLSAFVLASMVHGYRDGQEAARHGSLVSACLEQRSDSSPQLRQWLAICLARLWDHFDLARWTGVRDNAHEKLYILLKDPCPEVRAAAVYALGTFINADTKRSEHANNIDHSIAMTLINTVSGDMSCLVRQELIAALQWVVLLFEHSFLSVAAQETGSQECINSASPGGIRKVGSKDHIKILSPQTNYITAGGDHQSTYGLTRVASSSSISSLGHMQHGNSLGTIPALAYGSVYMKLWSGLCHLDSDPHPQVAQMSSLVTGYIRKQVKELLQFREAQSDSRTGASISLPPSPNHGNFIMADSPPLSHGHNIITRSVFANRTKKNSEDSNGVRQPLVKTQYVPWACKHFAQPVTRETPLHDVESMVYYEKQWRYLRNQAIRKEAKEEQKRAPNSRLESQVFNTRCAAAPIVIKFHPYDQQIVVAGRETFGIWDWGTGAKLSYCQCRSAKSATSRITALEWVNGHDIALLMVGADDGSVKLWRATSSNRDPQNRDPVLITAWQAFSEMCPTNRTSASAGVVLTWEQWTQTVITSGDTRIIRLWDAERELKAFDIPTGADCSVTCLDSTFSTTGHDINTNMYQKEDPDDDGLVMGPEIRQWDGQRVGELVAGCADGSVRLYDRRLHPNDARVKTWREHTDRVLDVQLRENEIISGSATGDVRIYDIRQNESRKVIQASQGMTALTIHRYANTFACGSVNQNIGIYNLSGDILNVIRFYEGFMGHRIGPISCLTYHPHRVALATGTTDCSVSVYCLEHRR